ncbi:hypothetical protein Dsin_004139 [Dipteronia sinensis]|uniref:Uncharacterized protein n=1 Tax=Dipteronia sinensis TaxID=43782 RepID=A0AAE0B906_9ROSI|nr:hypothetical protein Dsin_004139 [Dipteronia sinensis]
MLKRQGQMVNFDKSALCVSPSFSNVEGARLASIIRVSLVDCHERYLGLPCFSSRKQTEGYSYVHIGAVRIILTLHGRKGLPVTARIALLNTVYKDYEQAIIGTCLSTLHAGSVSLTRSSQKHYKSCKHDLRSHSPNDPDSPWIDLLPIQNKPLPIYDKAIQIPRNEGRLPQIQPIPCFMASSYDHDFPPIEPTSNPEKEQVF